MSGPEFTSSVPLVNIELLRDETVRCDLSLVREGQQKAWLLARLKSHTTHTLSAKRILVNAAWQVSWLP